MLRKNSEDCNMDNELVKKSNFKVYEIRNRDVLKMMEEQERTSAGGYIEVIPFAQNGTKYCEICENIIMDRDGSWVNPLIMTVSYHRAQTGARGLCKLANDFFTKQAKETNNSIDILSISSGMKGNRLKLIMLFRCYNNCKPDMRGLFDIVGDEVLKEEKKIEIKGQLVIPDEIKNFSYSQEEISMHKQERERQQKIYESSSEEQPFLNSIEHYVPKKLYRPEDYIPLVYDLKTKDMQIQTIASYEEFTKVFEEVMIYVNGIEFYRYLGVIQEPEKEDEFMMYLEDYVRSNYVNKRLFLEEDIPVLMDKLYRSLFQLYIVQDLIEDEDITDIKITSHDSIRVRVKGKAYLCNVTFIDENDLNRFARAISIRNNISLDVPEQTFTDIRDKNYILRLTVSAEYANCVDNHYIHIRKVSRNKLMGDDLIRLGMYNEVVRDYLIDCGRNSNGVIFCGPPGSGKTVALNWFLEDAYEQSAEILVIQENDELFCYRKGVMLQHTVSNPMKGQEPIDLERLGQLALVAGANVFVIGEVKGAEICSAVTLGNSGCRTALTIHSNSSTDAIDKMADLAMRGYAKDINDAKRMMKVFQTIVYLEDFCVKEISEIVGYDDEKKDMIYRAIYRKPYED